MLGGPGKDTRGTMLGTRLGSVGHFQPLPQSTDCQQLVPEKQCIITSVPAKNIPTKWLQRMGF